jgi:hypothetical protein
VEEYTARVYEESGVRLRLGREMESTKVTNWFFGCFAGGTPAKHPKLQKFSPALLEGEGQGLGAE